jgi:hypothetical protein
MNDLQTDPDIPLRKTFPVQSEAKGTVWPMCKTRQWIGNWKTCIAINEANRTRKQLELRKSPVTPPTRR